jgi:AcrR family transcriptional regulator
MSEARSEAGQSEARSEAGQSEGVGRPRGRYAKTAATRDAILDAALAVFAKNGFRAGSLRDIAALVGMSEAGMLFHFDSKARLLAAVLDRRDDLAVGLVPRHPEDGVTALFGLIELARFNASEPGVVELYCTLSAEATSPDHPAHDYFVRRYETVRETVHAAFVDLQTHGLLRPGVVPWSATRATVAMMDGLQVQWLLDRSLLDMAEDLRDFLQTLTTANLSAT